MCAKGRVRLEAVPDGRRGQVTIIGSAAGAGRGWWQGLLLGPRAALMPVRLLACTFPQLACIQLLCTCMHRSLASIRSS